MIDTYFKAILDNSPESIVLIGKNHEVLAFNKTIRDVLYQYHNREIKVGDTYYPDFVVAPSQQLYLEAFNSAINGKPFYAQNLTTNENVSYWFEYKMIPVFDENELLGVTLSAKNITKEKEAELKIIDLSEKLKAILDNTDEAITLLDLNYKILAINSIAIKTINYNNRSNLDNLVGIDFRELILDNGDLFYEYYSKAVSGKYCMAEISYKNSIGDLLWYQTKFNPVYDENKSRIGVSLFAKDITEKKMLEISLQESEDNFSKIAALSPVGILITESDFTIKYANAAANNIFGYNESEWKMLSLAHIIENFKISKGSKLQVDGLENEIEYPLFNQERLSAITKTKSTIKILLSSSSFLSKTKQNYIFIIQDITSINHKDDIIAEQNTKLRDIAWYQSHIIRAPLARIIGLTNFLKDDIISDEAERIFISNAICESAKELDKVIYNIVNKT